MLSISLASSSNPVVLRLLEKHPRVEKVAMGPSEGIVFALADWNREVKVGDLSADHYGLVEVMDNNPIVCADRISVPTPAATMALIGLAPLARAGLLTDSPVVALNCHAEDEEIVFALEKSGWKGGVTVHTEPLDIGGVLAATIMASITTPDDMEDLDSLFDEPFGRSFYVRRDETSDWGPGVVQNKPFACYRLKVLPDEPNSLITVRVLSDPHGKAGATQMVHAMNVMCGFEESLGIS